MKSKGGNHFVFSFGLALLWMFLSGQAVFAQQPPACTETWRKADNPHVISGTVTISSAQTVCVEPGVRVQFNSNGAVILNGRLIGTGTSADRIMFVGSNVSPNRFDIYGTMDVSFIDVTVPLVLHPGGTLLARNGRFGKYGIVDNTEPMGNYSSTFLLLENCDFDSDTELISDNASVYVSRITVILRNVAFRNEADCNISFAYLYMDGVATQNNPYSGIGLLQDSYQPQFLDNLNITNSGDAGLTFLNGNYELGPNVTIQNCLYPVRLGGGGLMPASHLPTSGNQNNWIEGYLAASAIIPPFEIPYVLNSATLGLVEILPGTHIKARPNFSFTTQGGPALVLGLPDAPIFFEPFTPGQKWASGQFTSTGDRMEYVVIDGSQRGIIPAGAGGTSYYIDNSIFRNNDIAVNAPSFHLAYLSGNLFTNNGIALNAEQSGGIRAVGQTNPNLFENNTLALKKEFTKPPPDVRFNWWNSPTGPTTPDNPGGTGDRIDGTAEFRPFRTERPDTTDHPPVVRLPRRPYRQTAGNYDGLIESGQRVILTWNAFDDRAIVKQKILFSFNGNAKENFTTLADNLPPGQREYEFTMPNVATANGQHKVIRIVAVDAKGQEGWDEWLVFVPQGTEPGVLRITSPVGGQTFRGGGELQVNYTTTTPFNNSQFQIYLVLDADHKLILAATGNQNGAFATVKLPFISTDSARIAVQSLGSSGQKWFFSEPFAIRPDSRWIDAPPTINLTSPAAGQHFQPGSTIPISWTAADDDALRGFSILISTDSGRTWWTIVENLPPTATGYNWQTPQGIGFDDLRVRVVAFDRRFQNSSDGANRSFSTANNQPNVPPTVELTYPPNGASYLIGQSTFVAANASDSDGTIARVEFYDGTKLIGLDATPPYQVGYNYLSGGTHTLTARAYDNLGAAATSSNTITIIVNNRPGPAPIPINMPSLSSPQDGATFNAPATITISATTLGASATRVEFYNGTTLIDSDTTAPYEVTWSNVPAGRYTIFAKTIATNGAEAFSQPADIVVGGATPQRRALADFDGDGKTDVSVWNPGTGTWNIINSSNGSTRTEQWGMGNLGDKPVPGDYDGDGTTDVAVWRESNATWYILQSSTNSLRAGQFGTGGDKPAPADFDGDGKTDLAIFRPSEGRWYILQSANNSLRADQWGTSEDKPVPADFDDDGHADLAVFRPSQATWYIYQSATNSFRGQSWGLSTDKLVAGDYDGDGKADAAVWRSSDGYWYALKSGDGAMYALQWGASGDMPVPGDYDGDGKSDPAVWRPSTGTWYVRRSSDGVVTQQNLGAGGDVPVPSAYTQN
ncbi:MAG: Ig-like domain-containing protein [Pyrinomonadaceae bacterium]